jgi:hypothetical protein
MVFASIYNYLTGAADETDAVADVPVRSPVEAIDDWELIETESTNGETVTTPVPCGAKHETSANGGRVQRRKNTKKINVLVSHPNYNKFLKSETNVANLGKVKSSKKQRQTNKTVNQPRSHKYQHRNKF